MTGPIRFDRFAIDPERGLLSRADGSEIRLRPKTFALLLHLVENANRPVGHDALMEAVWPDAEVTEDNIGQCVKEIRRALGDEEQRLLRTLPRRGYLLAAEVSREATGPPERFGFGPFQLDPQRRLLLRDGAPVELGSRAFDLLVALLRQAGQPVGKEALIRTVWGGQAVEENNLTVQVSALRRLLGGDPAGAPYIRTVAGRGYVFASPVTHARGAPPAPPPRMAGLPRPPSAFIGREAERAEVARRLEEHRLVCLTGLGGVGKTRLATEIGAELADRYPDGVVFLDLVPCTDPKRVADLLATALGAGSGRDGAEEGVLAALRPRRTLLILDNAEHLLDAVSRLVQPILAECPGIAMLVTSREPLGLAGESVVRLLPFATPGEASELSAEAALGYDAVRLFVERASKAVPGFALSAANAPAVVEICRRLDGIALAIEMAVPRLQVLEPGQLAARLQERFRLLAAPGRDVPSRQRTLGAMFDWSWELLPEEERRLLQRLAVFVGGARLDAVVALGAACGASEWETLDGLTALAGKSLATPEFGRPEPRYRLLETTRQYALGRLAPAEAQALAAAHAAETLRLFEQAEAAWQTTQSAAWLEHYGVEANNLRAALGWSFGPEGDEALGLRLVAASYPLWWDLPGLPLREGRGWFDLAAARLGPATPAPVAARIWFGHSWRDVRFGDRDNYPAAERAAALFREAGEPVGLGAALWRAGSAMLTQETLGTAERLFDEAERILRGQAPGKWLALTLVKRGDLLMRAGRFEEALGAYEEAMRLVRATGYWYGLMNGGSNMAELLFCLGQTERALRQLEDLRDELPPGLRTPLMATLAAHLALAGQAEQAGEAVREVAAHAPLLGFTGSLAWAAETLGLLMAAAGAPERAARLAGFARRVHPSVETRAGARREVFRRLDAALAEALAPAARQRLAAEGAGWNDAEAAAATGERPAAAILKRA